MRVGFVLACVLPGVVAGFVGGMALGTRHRDRTIQHIHAWDARAMVWVLDKLRDGQIDDAIKNLESQVTMKVKIAGQWDLPFAKGTRDMGLDDTMESLEAVKLYFDAVGRRDVVDGPLADVPLPPGEVMVREFDGKYRGTGVAVPELTVAQWLGEGPTLRDLRGKVVLLEFWGTWCRPCVETMPFTQRLYDTYKDHGLVVLAIHSSAKSDKAFEFVQERHYTFPVGIAGGKTLRDYAVVGFPSHYLIDRKGCLVWGPAHDITSLKDHQLILEEHIQRLLADTEGR